MAKRNGAEIKIDAKDRKEAVSRCDNPPVVADIERMIFTIRGVQVMFDRDLAHLYGVETRVLNQAVKRNIDRFPDDFMFQLTQDEVNGSRSQIVTLNKLTTESKSQNVILNTSRGHNIKYLPYAFTENGVAMLSSVLRSPSAVEVNIQIMRAFVAMRHFLVSNAGIFQRLDSIEQHQIAADQRIDRVFQLLETGQQPTQGIFFDGQVFDAYRFASELIRSAKKHIVLFDNYVDDTVLSLLDKRKKTVEAEIYTKSISQQLSLDIARHNAQYRPITVMLFDRTHDRFLCIDNSVYHIGASLKDLGKRWFAFSKMEMSASELINRL
ncbi:MAG: ORF6N domain-containing protein [Bacteroidales bacterium]|nr:ORF6N domain-containing protein [Bacteroidales bacterium]